MLHPSFERSWFLISRVIHNRIFQNIPLDDLFQSAFRSLWSSPPSKWPWNGKPFPHPIRSPYLCISSSQINQQSSYKLGVPFIIFHFYTVANKLLNCFLVLIVYFPSSTHINTGVPSFSNVGPEVTAYHASSLGIAGPQQKLAVIEGTLRLCSLHCLVFAFTVLAPHYIPPMSHSFIGGIGRKLREQRYFFAWHSPFDPQDILIKSIRIRYSMIRVARCSRPVGANYRHLHNANSPSAVSLSKLECNSSTVSIVPSVWK